LIVLGGVMQIVGVIWAVLEVEKIRQSLIAVRKVGQEIAAEIRSVLKGPPERRDATVHAVTARGSAHAGGRIVESNVVGPPPTLDERVERLEVEIRRLDEQAMKDRENLRAEAQRAREHADAIDRELRELIEAQEQQRRESQQTAERLQRRIAPLLVTGLILSAVGSVVQC
jgi:hypothetical protein